MHRRPSLEDVVYYPGVDKASVRDMKRVLRQAGVDTKCCLERRDLEALYATYLMERSARDGGRCGGRGKQGAGARARGGGGGRQEKGKGRGRSTEHGKEKNEKGEEKQVPDTLQRRYCGWCYKDTNHVLVKKITFGRNVYRCECSKRTVVCCTPGCSRMAKHSSILNSKLCWFCTKGAAGGVTAAGVLTVAGGVVAAATAISVTTTAVCSGGAVIAGGIAGAFGGSRAEEEKDAMKNGAKYGAAAAVAVGGTILGVKKFHDFKYSSRAHGQRRQQTRSQPRQRRYSFDDGYDGRVPNDIEEAEKLRPWSSPYGDRGGGGGKKVFGGGGGAKEKTGREYQKVYRESRLERGANRESEARHKVSAEQIKACKSKNEDHFNNYRMGSKLSNGIDTSIDNMTKKGYFNTTQRKDGKYISYDRAWTRIKHQVKSYKEMENPSRMQLRNLHKAAQDIPQADLRVFNGLQFQRRYSL